MRNWKSRKPAIRAQTLLIGFFVMLVLLYLSLSPDGIAGMGYTGEEMRAANQIVDVIFSSEPAETPIEWSRNGALPLVVHIPFLLASRAVAGASLNWQDRFLSMEPILATSALVTLLFVWCYRLTGMLDWSYCLALAAAFTTMLWPYAYIGLETDQSLFLLLAAYLSLWGKRQPTWMRTIAIALTSGFAIGMKSTGAFLIPAVAFLAFWYFRRQHRTNQYRLRIVPQMAVFLLILLGLFAVAVYTRSFFWNTIGGTEAFIRFWLVKDALHPLLNLVAFFGSPNKGLIIFAPIAILGLYYLPKACRTNPEIALFAILTLGGLAGGFSLLRNWADETWGPRYLHTAVAPLILCLAVSKRPQRLGKKAVCIVLLLLGFAVSFLGSFFSYGSLHAAAQQTSQSTLEALQGDIVWNHVRFNVRLLRLWHSPEMPSLWTPAHQWFFEKPDDAPRWQSIDLRPYAVPQSYLVRHWRTETAGTDRILCFGYLAAFALGTFLLVWLSYTVFWVTQVPMRD